MPLGHGGSTSVEWTITDAERATFAAFSGDHNPIHTDPVAARRLTGGRMIVHGAHLLLAAIDHTVATGQIAAGSATIDAQFLHGVVPDRPLLTTVTPTDDDTTITITITYDVWSAVEIVIARQVDAGVGAGVDVGVGAGVDAGVDASVPGPLSFREPTAEPDDVPFDRLDEVCGAITTGDDDVAERLFPSACAAFGPGFVAELAALSRVVGMHAPGRRSLSSRYRISTTGGGSADGTLRFGVTRVHARTRRVDVDVTADHLTARIEAFSPEGPVDQRAELADGARPTPTEFTGRRVLVVGGSRGLGAAAAELLRAGGADVRCAARTKVDWRFDAEHGAAELDAIIHDGWRPTSLCWFATPPYGDGRRGLHSGAHAAELIAVQVHAFVTAVDRLRDLTPPLAAAFWPSADTGTNELLAAKLAGEAAAEELRQRHDGLTVLTPRLPTMLTDQTRSLLPMEYADTADTLLEVLRELPA